jgi:quercetin dioxygenase-like cupin family protein
MDENLIVFRDMPWDNPSRGVRCKAYTRGRQKLRMVEFSDDFTEKDWCTKGHVGYVLEGEMEINYRGRMVKYSSGDGIFIEEGVENKHKAVIPKGKKALLILVEKA